MRTNVVFPVWVSPPEVRPAAGLSVPIVQLTCQFAPFSGMLVFFSGWQMVVLTDCL